MKLTKDKKLHLIGGILISFIVGGVLLNPLYGIVVAALIGMLKESYDSTGRGDVDVWDFGATAFGGVLGACVLIVVMAIL